MPKICDMSGVREYGEGDPVELWRGSENGRLVVVARNEAGLNETSIDLMDLVDWLRQGPGVDLAALAPQIVISLPDDGTNSQRN